MDGWSARRHDASATLPFAYRSTFSPNEVLDTSLVSIQGNPEWVAFYMDATGYQHLTYSLINSNGDPINEMNVNQYPEITFNRLGGRWTYLVSNPASGDWYMVVDGIIGDETYQVDAFIKDSNPLVNLTNITSTSQTILNDDEAADIWLKDHWCKIKLTWRNRSERVLCIALGGATF